MSSPASAAAPPARFERPRDGRMVGGVCAGLARHLRVDVTLVRLVVVVLAILSVGVPAYVAAVLISPAEGEAEPPLQRAFDGEDRLATAGLVLLGILALILWDGPFDGPFDWAPLWLLVGAGLVGAYVLLDRERAARRTSVAAAGDPAEAPTAVVPPAQTSATPPPPPPPGPNGLLVAGLVLLVLAAGAGVVALAGPASWDVVLASAVLAIGALLLVGAFFGGLRWLIPLGVVVVLASSAAAVVDLDLSGGTGERVHRPGSVEALKPAYELGIGQLTVDLRDVDLPPGETVVTARIGIGELVVRAPEDAAVVADAHVGAGELEVLGRRSDGFDVDQRAASPPPSPSAARLRVEAEAGAGRIVVVRGDASVGDGR